MLENQSNQFFLVALKSKTLLTIDRTKFLEGINSLLSDSSKFTQLLIDEDK